MKVPQGRHLINRGFSPWRKTQHIISHLYKVPQGRYNWIDNAVPSGLAEEVVAQYPRAKAAVNKMPSLRDLFLKKY